jgi:hypothetical protein
MDQDIGERHYQLCQHLINIAGRNAQARLQVLFLLSRLIDGNDTFSRGIADLDVGGTVLGTVVSFPRFTWGK